MKKGEREKENNVDKNRRREEEAEKEGKERDKEKDGQEDGRYLGSLATAFRNSRCGPLLRRECLFQTVWLLLAYSP